jgi:hypothetical protein
MKRYARPRDRLSVRLCTAAIRRHERLPLPPMRSIPRLSIGRLMGLIALFAVELALFQRVLSFIVMIPPITVGIVSLNLAVLYALRWLPRAAASRIYGMLCAGLIALFMLVGYYIFATPGPWPIGAIGTATSRVLFDLAASRTDPSDPTASFLRSAARTSRAVEIVLLDLFGLAVIWAGGWIAGRRHAGGTAPLATQDGRPSPLDDRAVTPL